jgi:hypothetical protein
MPGGREVLRDRLIVMREEEKKKGKREKKVRGGGGGGRTFVDVRKVGAEARDWFENRLPAESAGRVSYESRRNARPGGEGEARRRAEDERQSNL